MVGRPVWYELMAPDVRTVAPFYSALLSWDIANAGTKMPNGAEYHMIGRPDDKSAGGVLVLTAEMQRGGARPGWLPYFEVENVDAAVANAARLDGHTTLPPQDIPDAGRIAMLADPKGAPFYLIKPTPPRDRTDTVSDVFDAKKTGHCRWNELLTTNAPAAKAFYRGLLGWRIEDKMPLPDDGEYLFVDCGNERIGAISPRLTPASMPCWLPYFGVENVERSVAIVQTNGGKIVQELTPIPHDEFSFVATDPGGALVGFCGPKSGKP
jgi:predicted enzyme related to lactoylglutathione lyase